MATMPIRIESTVLPQPLPLRIPDVRVHPAELERSLVLLLCEAWPWLRVVVSLAPLVWGTAALLQGLTALPGPIHPAL